MIYCTEKVVLITSAILDITKIILLSASAVIQQNVTVLFEGSRTETPACAVSKITGIPLIRLYGDSRPFEQCEKAVQMSAGYRDFAHASLDIINTFRWKKIALVFDGKNVLSFLIISSMYSVLERFHSRDQRPYWFTETKENVCVKIELNYRRIGLVQQYGRLFLFWNTIMAVVTSFKNAC